MSLRDYLQANLFDGDDGGIIEAPIGSLLDDICEMTALWFVEESGVEKMIEDYFNPPEPKTTG